jgi:uncharacterized protein involved in exopolysaccharide biosynthesis
MSSASDTMQPGLPKSGAHSYARLNTRVLPERQSPPAPRPVHVPPQRRAEPETVTLDKVGDFLELDLRRITLWLQRGLVWIIALAVAGAVAGLLFGMLAQPKYTVRSDILIDPAGLQVMGEDLYAAPGQQDAQILAAGSKLRVMTSGNVLRGVIADLDLTNDPEFVSPTTELPRDVAALSTLREAIGVTTDERSFVVTLGVETESIPKSIAISERIVARFREELARAETEGATRLVAELDGRLAELRTNVNDAEQAVEAYKRENGLQQAAGELTSTISLNQINTQVIEAQARVIAAESAYNELLSGGVGSNEAGGNATLDALRAQLATARQTLQSQSTIYGARHPLIVEAQTNVRALEGQVQSETARVVEGAKTRLDEAQSALTALTSTVNTQRETVFADSAALVELRELEREAQSTSAIYEAFLARAQQLSERSEFDTTNVQVISEPSAPVARSYPPRTLLLIIMGGFAGVMLGLGLAVGLGMLRDMRAPRRVIA